jgi:GTP pyrophosphokinase
VPLSRELKNSETVEIIRSPNARPSRDWLAHVRTGRARHRIRQWLRHEEESTSIRIGSEILERELKRRRHAKLTDAQLQQAATELKLSDETHLFASIGQGDINVTQVLRALYPDFDARDDAALKASPLERLIDRMKGSGTSKGIRIQGVDGLMVRYAQCCQPVPGDKVVGYVTRGRGVSIHRGDCPNLLFLAHEPERRIDIDWKESEGERFVIRLAIEASDRRGLYADLAQAVSETGTDIRSLELKTTDGRVSGAALVEVENLAHLEKIIKAVRRVKGVSEVSRRERLTSET